MENQHTAGIDPTIYWMAMPGDRVLTVDGTGVVNAVSDGPFPGNEDYNITLDNGLGGGFYASGQVLEVLDHKIVTARRYSQTPLACDDCGTPARHSISGGMDGHTMLCDDCLEARGRQPRTAARVAAPLLSIEEARKAGLHIASDEDYPELGNILWERPDLDEVEDGNMPTRVHMSSRKTASDPGEYGVTHRPSDDGPPVNDLTREGADWSMPDDVYEHPDWYLGNRGSQAARETIKAVLDARGKSTVTIFRVSPVGEFNNGDWVSLSRSYAMNESRDESTSVWSVIVPSSMVIFAGDDLNEFGYFGPAITSGVQKTAMNPDMMPKKAPDINPIKKSLDDKRQPFWWRKIVGPMVDRYNDALPPVRQVQTVDDLNSIPSEPWCRFRSRNSHCFFPKILDENGTKEAGYSVWIPENRGTCPYHTKETQRDKCPVSEPGSKSGERMTYPDATLSWAQGGQRMASHTARIVKSSWNDIVDKAKRIRTSGGVRIISVAGDTITAEVRGDSGLYVSTVTFVPGTKQIGISSCSCPAETYRWMRSGRWKHLQGRSCSHIVATLFEIQAEKMFGGEVTEDSATPIWRTEQPKLEPDRQRPGEWRVDRAAVRTAMLDHASALISLRDDLTMIGSFDHDDALGIIITEALAEVEAPESDLTLLSSLKIARDVDPFYAKIDGRMTIVEYVDDDGTVWVDGRWRSSDEVIYPTYDPTLGMTGSLKTATEVLSDWREIEPGKWLLQADDGFRAVFERSRMTTKIEEYASKFGDASFGWQRNVNVFISGVKDSGKILSGTASSLDAAKAKAMRAGQKDIDEALAKNMENMRQTMGPDWGTPNYHPGLTGSLKTAADSAALVEMIKESGEGDFKAAGLVIKARDSGRVLMTQRTPYHNDDEEVYGRWEFPGGCLDDEDPLTGAMREFSEETGLTMPDGWRVDGHQVNDGYMAVLITVPHESWSASAVLETSEVMGIGWFDPDHIADSPMTRAEVDKTDWKMVKEATIAKTANYPKMYHLTDKVDFRLNPNKRPDNNTTLGGTMEPGIFLSASVEAWVNGYGYWRPWVVEFILPNNLDEIDGVIGGYSGELFIPAGLYGKLTMIRIIPLDAYCREEFGGWGWTEEWTGLTFDTEEPISKSDLNEIYKWRGYKYPGDARQTDSGWQDRYKKRIKQFAKTRTNAIASLAMQPSKEAMAATIGPFTLTKGTGRQDITMDGVYVGWIYKDERDGFWYVRTTGIEGNYWRTVFPSGMIAVNGERTRAEALEALETWMQRNDEFMHFRREQSADDAGEPKLASGKISPESLRGIAETVPYKPIVATTSPVAAAPAPVVVAPVVQVKAAREATPEPIRQDLPMRVEAVADDIDFDSEFDSIVHNATVVEAARDASADVGDGVDTCRKCGSEDIDGEFLTRTGSVDPSDPEATWTVKCGACGALQNDAILHAEPEPALPYAYGEKDDSLDSPPDSSQAKFVPNDPRLSHLMGGPQKDDNNDIAIAAAAMLSKTALKNFSRAEMDEIISENGGEARNLARLSLEGTHYEGLMSSTSEEDDAYWI